MSPFFGTRLWREPVHPVYGERWEKTSFKCQQRGGDRGVKNKLLKIEKFVVCPNCRKPVFRASNLRIKGSAIGYNFCGNCGYEMLRAFKGTPAGEGMEIPEYANRKNKLPL